MLASVLQPGATDASLEAGMLPGDSRYDRFGWDYTHVNPPDARALAWVRRHARETGGPVLELACGTGPLLAALAAEGHAVAGLDASMVMLDLARKRIAALAGDVGGHVELVRGDMRDFQLAPEFALAVVADNSWREVETLEGMRSCLRCIRRHLRPDGRLLVAERRFDPSKYTGGVAEWPWSAPLPHPESGVVVRRRIRVRFDAQHRRLQGVMTYRTVAADASEGPVDESFPFESPVLEPEAYIALFAEAGFEARVFGGYGSLPDDGQDPMLCFVAVPTGGGVPGC